MKKYLLVLLVVGLIFGLGACARPTDIHECVNNTPGGFWWGLWNGICAPFSFIGSLFSNDISMYDINNNGGWYDFGFVLGAGILFGGSSTTVKSKSK